mmetsp:Transcript_40489/g.114687  ORF Transcript_40489/g.114687 Transcript_40489/m.114687 type:complete len:256 (-) Transcript_40489:389-1156(-)
MTRGPLTSPGRVAGGALQPPPSRRMPARLTPLETGLHPQAAATGFPSPTTDQSSTSLAARMAAHPSMGKQGMRRASRWRSCGSSTCRLTSGALWLPAEALWSPRRGTSTRRRWLGTACLCMAATTTAQGTSWRGTLAPASGPLWRTRRSQPARAPAPALATPQWRSPLPPSGASWCTAAANAARRPRSWQATPGCSTPIASGGEGRWSRSPTEEARRPPHVSMPLWPPWSCRGRPSPRPGGPPCPSSAWAPSPHL